MLRNWQPEELIEHWTLLPSELALLANKTDHNRLGFALLLKFFQYAARFPNHQQEMPSAVIDYVALQVGVPPQLYENYDWQGRSVKYHRAQIREFFGFREATVADAASLTEWLAAQVLAYDLKIESLLTAAYQHLRALKIEPPTPERLERITRSAMRTFEERLCATTVLSLSPATIERLDALISPEVSDTDAQAGIEESSSTLTTPLAALKADPGWIGLDSLQKEVAKLQLLRQLCLPDKLFERVSSKVLQTYRQRVAVEPPRELRRHPSPRRYTFLSAFCWLRSQEITDNLVELLISIIHRIGARAEQRVEKELLDDFKRVSGKTGLLFRLAEAALNQPDGVVREVVYPVVGEQTLKNLVREFKSSGNAYREKANGFIFYGKGKEIATNRLEDQEIAVLSLHLLQSCLVYVNTLMIQQVLSQAQWMELMQPEDLRALTPLIWGHVNPYGTFQLDLEERLPIETAA